MALALLFKVFLFALALFFVPAVDSILVRGPVTTSFASGRLSLKDAACGTLSVGTDEFTKFSATGLPLATPNDVEISIDGASDCSAASVAAATRVTVLTTGTVKVFPPVSGVVARLNLGGGAFTDSAGVNWSAETGFTG